MNNHQSQSQCQAQYDLCTGMVERDHQECLDDPQTTKENCTIQKDTAIDQCSDNKNIKQWMDDCVETLKNTTTDDVSYGCQKTVGDSKLPVWGLVLIIFIFFIIIIGCGCWCSNNPESMPSMIALRL